MNNPILKSSDLALEERQYVDHSCLEVSVLHYVRMRPSSFLARQSKTLAAPLASGRGGHYEISVITLSQFTFVRFYKFSIPSDGSSVPFGRSVLLR